MIKKNISIILNINFIKDELAKIYNNLYIFLNVFNFNIKFIRIKYSRMLEIKINDLIIALAVNI